MTYKVIGIRASEKTQQMIADIITKWDEDLDPNNLYEQENPHTVSDVLYTLIVREHKRLFEKGGKVE